MPRNATPLALLALLAIGAAITAGLAGGGAPAPGPAPDPGPTPPESRPPDSGPAAEEARQRTPRDPAEEVAADYALAARTWTPASYRNSWERQIALAGGRHRRQLAASRPGAAQVGALESDRASSEARLVEARRDPRVADPEAQVLVTLDERTVAAGQTIAGETVNRVNLRRVGGRWRVVGFTVLPGGATPGSGA